MFNTCASSLVLDRPLSRGQSQVAGAEAHDPASHETALEDAYLVEQQGFEATQALLASVLITSLRTFQHFERRGVAFARVTPELIVQFVRQGEKALDAHAFVGSVSGSPA